MRNIDKAEGKKRRKRNSDEEGGSIKAENGIREPGHRETGRRKEMDGVESQGWCRAERGLKHERGGKRKRNWGV